MASTTNTCNICCENFNKSTCKPVICGFGDCNFECCKTCTRTYLMGTTADPHCMNCKKTWDDEFLIKISINLSMRRTTKIIEKSFLWNVN